MSSVADVRVVERQPADAFLLLACDGVWDVMRSVEAISFVAQCFETTSSGRQFAPAERHGGASATGW